MSRLTRTRAEMRERGLAALLVTKRENVCYLSGFTSEDAALLVTDDSQCLLTDFRYLLQAAQEAPGWTIVRVEHALLATIREQLSALGPVRIGIDPDHLTLAAYRSLGGDDPTAGYTLHPAPRLLEQFRLVKSPEELAHIRAAVALTDAALAHLLPHIRPGVTERELALEAEWYMRRHGADAVAFEVIVAAGARGALPHAVPGDTAVRAGDLVVIDMGARVAQYCADMTRTVAVGHATPLAREIYRITLDAQLAGLAGIHAGMTGREADRLVRDVIVAAGYGDAFGHGTGHGVGLEIHEAPRLNRTATDVLPAGAAVTVEPGIYLPEVGGVRIEDLVVVTETGATPLTAAPKPAELPVVG